MLNASSAARAQSVHWTRPYLVELSDVIRQALESWAGEPDENAPDLDRARASARQLAATLNTLNIEGAAGLSATLAEALEAIDQPDAETATVLLETVAVLPDYLERLETGAPDTPEVLHGFIDRMRGAAGLGDTVGNGVAELLPEHRRELDPVKLRRDYQRALRDWLRDPTATSGLTAFAGELQAAQSEAVARLGLVAEAIFAGLAEGQIRPGPGLQAHLAGLDKLLHGWQQSGVAGENHADVERVTVNLLDDLRAAPSGNPGIDRVLGAMEGASAAAPSGDSEEIERARRVLSGRNRELFTALADAARGELGRAKEALNEFLLGRQTSESIVAEQAATLRSVAESFAMLGLNRLRDRVREQADRLGDLTADPDNPVLLDVARELLLVESELDEAVLFLGEAPESSLLEGDGQHLPKAEHRRVMRQVLRESLEDIGQAKHLLDQAHRGQADHESVRQAMGVLTRVAGVLRMAGQEQPADMLGASVRWIEADMLGEDEADRSRLEGLAEALVVVEFYLDSLTRLDDRGVEYLQSAREDLIEMGFLQADEAEAEVESETETELDSADELDFEPESETEAEPELEIDVQADDDASPEAEFDVAAPTSGDEPADEPDESTAETDDEGLSLLTHFSSAPESESAPRDGLGLAPPDAEESAEERQPPEEQEPVRKFPPAPNWSLVTGLGGSQETPAVEPEETDEDSTAAPPAAEELGFEFDLESADQASERLEPAESDEDAETEEHAGEPAEQDQVAQDESGFTDEQTGAPAEHTAGPGEDGFEWDGDLGAIAEEPVESGEEESFDLSDTPVDFGELPAEAESGAEGAPLDEDAGEPRPAEAGGDDTEDQALPADASSGAESESGPEVEFESEPESEPESDSESFEVADEDFASFESTGFETAEDQTGDQARDEEHPAEASSESEPEREAPAESEPETEVEAEAEPETEAATGASSVFDDDDFDLMEIFLEEFDEELAALNERYPNWKNAPTDHGLLTDIRRSFHTLKGSGRMAGAERIGEFAWQVEQVLNQTLDGQYQPEQVIDLTAEAIAALPSLRAAQVGETPELDEQAIDDLQARFGRIGAENDLPELENLDQTLIQLMIKEISDHLQTIDRWVEDSRRRGWPAEISRDLIRAVHTIKGTLRLAPIGTEAESMQLIEEYLQEVLDTDADPADASVDMMEDMRVMLSKRLDRLNREAVSTEHFETQALSDRARALLDGLHGRGAAATASEQDADEIAGFVSAEEAFDETTGMEADLESGADAELESPAESGSEDEHEPEAGLEADADLESEAAEHSEDESDAEAELEAGAGLEDESDLDVKTGFFDEVEAAPGAEAGAELDEEPELESEPEPGTGLDEHAGTDEAEDEAEFEPEAEPETGSDLESELEPVAEWDAREEPEPEPDYGLEASSDGWSDQAEAPEAEPATETASPSTIPVDYDALDLDLLELFTEEAQELLEHSDDLLQQWREKPDDRQLVTALQRDIHTVKGSARMAGLNAIGEVAHVLEDLLENIAAGRQKATPVNVDTMESGCDHLHAMLDAVAKREPLPARPAGEEFDEDEAALEVEEQQADVVDDAGADQERVARGTTLRVASETVEDLLNFAGEISIFRSRIEQEIGSLRGNIGEIDQTVVRLREQLRKLEQETEAQILSRYEREHGSHESTFDPLELDRYSTIQQLSRALAESVSDLNSLSDLIDDGGRQAETLLMQQARVNTELQEGLMQARMVSFNTLAPRLRRVVRNAARDTGCKAELRIVLEGEGELDRNVLDRVTAPLEHILRNAIAHGIEAPDDRRAAGKSDTGTITISIGREATELLIHIADDGAGLNYQRIASRALERGLLTPEQAEDRDQLAQVIFTTGFSTAEEVSELAGRGVGMDVVSSEVRQIGGRISVGSEPGEGTRFTLRIPLSLAVMQAIFVHAGERLFAMPLQAVKGVARIRPDEWREALDSDGSYSYGGQSWPLIELDPLLGFDPVEIGSSSLSLLMVASGDQRAAIRVAEIENHREIVLKPVGPHVSSIPGVLGGTIMGDGQVVVILDAAPLIDQALSDHSLPGLSPVPEHAAEEEVKRTPLVMVVDDSITMRRVTARILENQGLEVITARDGVEAVDLLYERVPDVMLLDIEMPRMDGFELAAYVRGEPRLADVPLMMITSRSGDKHREHAREIGVERYMIKPYQEANMVRNVFEMLELPVPGQQE